MHDEQSFLQAMQVDPGDNALRLVFADWLEERGDLRGELIRLQHTLTQSIKVPRRARLEERMRKLVASGVKPVGPFLTNSIGMTFAWIPAGTFMMGSPEDEEGRYDVETQHKVTLSKGFYLGIHPVTQAFWQQVTGNNPSRFKGDDLPVENVSWDDCQEFLRNSSKRDGHEYRLPTEAEWEYACRAGTTTPFHFGETISTDQANYNGNHTYGRGKKGKYRGQTTLVGLFPTNPWGLFDMQGNVWEWCGDWYGRYPSREISDPKGPQSGDSRVLRSGSWGVLPRWLRSANRNWSEPADNNEFVGFRVAMTFTAE